MRGLWQGLRQANEAARANAFLVSHRPQPGEDKHASNQRIAGFARRLADASRLLGSSMARWLGGDKHARYMPQNPIPQASHRAENKARAVPAFNNAVFKKV